MSILIFNPQKREVGADIKLLISKYQNWDQELVLCFGGDGTILGAEAKYPGVPKLPVKVSEVCRMCTNGDTKEILESVINGLARAKEYLKLEVEVGGKRLVALNEVNIRSSDPRSALRFSCGEDKRVIGDGVVVATPFGASGYFENIARTVFELGIGIVYNNSNLGPKTRIIKEDRVVKIEIMRGPGIVYVDNNPESIEVNQGDVIIIKKSRQVALIFGNP